MKAIEEESKTAESAPESIEESEVCAYCWWQESITLHVIVHSQTFQI